MRTAKEIMERAFEEALQIIVKNGYHDTGDRNIAASNLAMAIFSFEVEMEAMKESHEEVDEDGSTEIDPDRGF